MLLKFSRFEKHDHTSQSAWHLMRMMIMAVFLSIGTHGFLMCFVMHREVILVMIKCLLTCSARQILSLYVVISQCLLCLRFKEEFGPVYRICGFSLSGRSTSREASVD